MSNEHIYIGDTGTEITLDVKEDISDSTARTIEAMKPDGSVVSLTATLVDQRFIRAYTIAGTLDQPGQWKLQAKVTTPTGLWRGKTAKLKVHDLFD